MKLFALLMTTAVLLAAAPATAGGPSYPLLGVRLLGGTGYDAGHDVAVAPDGSIYVLGVSRSKNVEIAGMADIVLAKFGPTGGPKWVRYLGGTQEEQAGGVAVGPDGSVYIAGTTYGDAIAGIESNGSADALVAKYTAAGERTWVRLFGTSEADGAYDIAVDDTGAVFLAGMYQAPSRSDMMFARLDSDGNREWLRRRGGSGEGDDVGLGVAVSDDALYFTGETWSPKFLGHTNKGEADAVLFRFGKDGKQRWVRYYSTAMIDRFSAVAIASGGNVYVAGQANTPLCCGVPSDFGDLLVATYEDDGNRNWVLRHGSPHLDGAQGVAASPYGGAYVAGYWDVEPFDTGNSQAALWEYSIAPSQSVARYLGGPKQDSAAGVAVGPDKSVWVVGTTTGPIGKQTTAGKSDIVLYRLKQGPRG